MSCHHRVSHDTRLDRFGPASMGRCRLAYLALAAESCQRSEVAALVNQAGQRLSPFSVLTLWVSTNEQGCAVWLAESHTQFEAWEDDLSSQADAAFQAERSAMAAQEGDGPDTAQEEPAVNPNALFSGPGLR